MTTRKSGTVGGTRFQGVVLSDGERFSLRKLVRRAGKTMKNGNAASTPKDLDVKPTALGMLLDAIGAVGGWCGHTRQRTTREMTG